MRRDNLMKYLKLGKHALAAGLVLLVAACSDSSSNNPGSLNNKPDYAVSGTITGLAGSGMVLQNNGAGDLTIAKGATAFSFSTQDPSATFAIAIKTQPGKQDQQCTVDKAKASGKLAGVTVNDINISCRNKFVYFSGRPPNSQQVWRTDGTTEGTGQFAKGVIPESLSLVQFLPANEIMYFSASDIQRRNSLWKTDGTANGTVLVKQFTEAESTSSIQELSFLNNSVYFTANDGIHGIELWKSDGTEAGTVMVKDINSKGNSNPFNLTAFNGSIYFRADDGVHGQEVWKSDGTALGTVLIKDLYSGPRGSGPGRFVVFDKALYFIAVPEASAPGQRAQFKIFKTDGTNAGTSALSDELFITNERDSGPPQLFNGSLYFTTSSALGLGLELWKTNGTKDNTVRVKEIIPNSDEPGSPQFFVFGDYVYFSAGSRGNNDKKFKGIYKSDGTEGGTSLHAQGILIGSDYAPTVMNGYLYFPVLDQSTGDNSSLWRTDGSQVTQLDLGQQFGYARDFFGYFPGKLLPVINGSLLLMCSSSGKPQFLCTTDGTPAGTSEIKRDFSAYPFWKIF